MRILFILLLFVFSCKENKKQEERVAKKQIEDKLIKTKDSLSRVEYESKIKVKVISDTFILENKFLRKTKYIKTPKEISNLIKGASETFIVDVVGNNGLRYITRVEDIQEGKKPIIEYWITKDLEIIRSYRTNAYSYIFGFLNIDNDTELEYIRIDGEEIVDYVLCDVNNLREKELFYFLPVIEYDGNYYLGYQHLIEDIIYKKEKNNIVFKCIENYTFINDDREGRYPKWQKQLPVLLFKGNKESFYKIEDLKSFQFYKIEDLRNKVLQR
ncbi:hypothetical protein [Tamlana sp. I1]|uniref:hypothetical protein n=1 Tax=Tamlana sp. I1 TaxID=2762061 RepID=UPI00188F18B6|nr:hypothetical protein [Tamlana sp. I1]